MVEFKKLLGKKEFRKPIDPIEIYENLDKASDRPYLRPPQIPILEDWFNDHRDKRDILIKLPTGQGKTLIGFLLLQSFLNEKKGPAIYVCPNNYLVDQILKEAKLFGIKAIKFDDSRPPQSFLNSEAILVANCSKVFNGKSVFGVRGSGREYVDIGAFVMDDAHKCLDIIKQQFSVIIDRNSSGEENPLYSELWNLFKDSLEEQAAGTCLDIE
jgi:replicative superfamily II helicase